MSFIEVTNLLTGFVELLLATMILRESRKIGRGFPPLVLGLAGFFVADAAVAINRSGMFWSRSESFAKATALDVIALLVLTIVVVNAQRIVQAAVATVDLAKYRAQEYERARRDYTQVVRHRVMNPITVILGATETLRSGALANEQLAHRLLNAIEASARIIEAESLAPERRDDLERELNAIPTQDER